jgi:hypothetical protein
LTTRAPPAGFSSTDKRTADTDRLDVNAETQKG